MCNYEAKSSLFTIKTASLYHIPRQNYSRNSHGSYILKSILENYIKLFRANKKRNNTSVICYRSISVSYTILYLVMKKKQFLYLFWVQVVAMRDAEFNQVQILRELSISCYCVQNAINKYKYLDTYKGSKHSGRPKKLDGQGLQH